MSADKYSGNKSFHARTWDAQLSVLGYERLTGLSSVQSLTVPDGARIGTFQAEQQNVRIRMDGVNPTAGVGMILIAGQWYYLNIPLDGVRVIEATSGAILNVTYHGEE